MVDRTLQASLCAAALMACLSACGASSAAPTPQTAVPESPAPKPDARKTIRDVSAYEGLAPDIQRGDAVFNHSCGSCHGSIGQGALGPPIKGPRDPIFGDDLQLAAYVQEIMPTNLPGTLTPQQAVDVVAWLRNQ